MKNTITGLILTGLALGAWSCRADEPKQKVRVFARSSHAPVACKLVWIAPDGSNTALGETDEKAGELLVNKTCAGGCYIMAIPVDKYTFFITQSPCERVFEKGISLDEIAQPKIVNLSKELSVTDDAISRALISEKIRGTLGDTEHGDAYRCYGAITFSKILKEPRPLTFDPTTDKHQLSDRYVKQIEELQSGLSIPVSGKLDTRTLAVSRDVAALHGPEYLQDAVVPTRAHRHDHD